MHSEIDATVALGAARESGVSACYTAHEATNEAAQFAPLADGVIAVSNGVGRFLREGYRLSDGVLHVIPNGIDPARLCREPRQFLRPGERLPRRRNRVLLRGSASRQQERPRVVRAFARVATAHQGCAGRHRRWRPAHGHFAARQDPG